MELTVEGLLMSGDMETKVARALNMGSSRLALMLNPLRNSILW